VLLEVAEQIQEIVLNAVDLVIAGGRLEGPGGRSTLPTSASTLDRTCAPAAVRDGEAWGGTLHLAFSGVLSERMDGFYRSTYEDLDGITRTIATTQFESTDARRAFRAGTSLTSRRSSA
jgi:aminopeptidase N